MTEYKVTGKGLVIGEPLRGYRGLTSGIPGPWSPVSGELDPELREQQKVRPGKRKKNRAE
jgi:hypothetical protein